MSDTVRGSCLCGTVTFEVAAPYAWFAHCHCSMCRKHHGTPYSTGVGVQRARFRWLSGEDEIVHYRATAAFERPFCRQCGATVPGATQAADLLHVPAGLLDGDLGARPRTHIFVASKASWHTINDDLPKFDTYPAGIAAAPPASQRDEPTPPGEIAGGCLCNAVRYTVGAVPRRVVACHCSRCRHSRGTAFASTLTFPLERLRFERGGEGIRTFRLPAPRTFGLAFCGACGSFVPLSRPDIGLALVPAGGIDTPLPPLAVVHIHVASKAPWDTITDSGTQFDAMPPPERFGELLS